MIFVCASGILLFCIHFLPPFTELKVLDFCVPIVLGSEFELAQDQSSSCTHIDAAYSLLTKRTPASKAASVSESNDNPFFL